MLFRLYMVDSFFVNGFRNLQAINLSIDSSLIVLKGANGQGKTNILEALSLVACGSSFRSHAKEYWLPFSSSALDFAEVKLHLTEDVEQKVILAKDMSSAKLQIKCWKNEILVPRQDFIGSIPVVVFEPQDMNLFYGDPSMRRNFMDNVLIQISPAYRKAYGQAKKVVLNRNHILKNLNKGESTLAELSFWDQKYQELSSLIQTERQKLCHFLALSLPHLYESFTSQRLNLELHYKQSLFDPEKYHIPEKARGFTLSGQHRDDIFILMNNLPWNEVSSRGEMRTAVLALKSALLQFLASVSANRPLFILDDIFSELDENRRKLLLQWQNDYQIFISAASDLPDLATAQVFTVEAGRIVL